MVVNLRSFLDSWRVYCCLGDQTMTPFHDYKDTVTFTINGWKIVVVVVGAVCWIGIAYLFAVIALAFVP